MKTTMRVGRALLLSGALLASACATPYGPASESLKGGYSDYMLQNDRFNVSFVGNAYISEEQAIDYLLYRCAEITRKHGFDYFVVVAEEGIATAKGALTKRLRVTIELRKGQRPADNPDAYGAQELMRNLQAKIER